MQMRFGPSGNSESFFAEGHKTTIEQPKWLYENFALDAFEYSFGRGVRITEKSARQIGEAFEAYGIQKSVHAPYFINLATEEEQKKANCLKYFEQACRAAQWMGAKRVIFHPGAQGKMEREQAVENILTLFPQILEKLEAQGLLEGITLCPETMGKLGQIGDIEEILCICALDERLIPCVDFGHIYARRLGQFGDKKSFASILDGIESSLGKERAKQIHVHFSRIEFTKGGEKRHWNYQDIQYGPNFDPLAALLAQRDYTAVVICESSGKMAEDAATYRDMYLKAREAWQHESKM